MTTNGASMPSSFGSYTHNRAAMDATKDNLSSKKTPGKKTENLNSEQYALAFKQLSEAMKDYA